MSTMYPGHPHRPAAPVKPTLGSSVQQASGTIIDLLDRHAELRTGETSFVSLPDGEREEARISFGQLERRASALARELGGRGMRGERVVLMFSHGLDFVPAFFGCLAAGVIAVPVCPPRRPDGCEHALKIAAAAGARMIVTDAGTRARLFRMGEAWQCALPLHVFTWLAEAPEVTSRAEGPTVYRPRAEDIAFLQFTSGSTGDPKGVVVTHANIMANQRGIQRGFQHGDETVVVSWLPFHHDMGLVGMVMQPVFLGRPCVLMPPEVFIQKPMRWLTALSRYRATTSGGPTFGYQRCLDGIGEAELERCEGLDLRAWKLAFAGAEPVRAACLEGFARRFSGVGFDSRALYPCYGLAEATLMVTGVRASCALRSVRLDAQVLGKGKARDARHEPSTRLVSCGRIWGDEELFIVDPETRMPVAENTVGEIWVSGPSVARGYYRRAVETEERFRATSPELPAKRFLRTGDLGFIRDGELFVAGRLQDLLIINGRNYFPHDIERTVAAVVPASCRPQAAVFADDELQQARIVLVQAVYPHRAHELEAAAMSALIRRAVGVAHELRLSEIFFTTSRLPVTTSGKIRRHACRDAWQAGLLKPLNPRDLKRGSSGSPHEESQ
ncbi:MAG: fatty acyl-AMP ligase [Gammaproteobacteria bacterium]